MVTAVHLQLDCTQRAQPSANSFNLNQKWSGIRRQISGLIRVSVGALPKCGFIRGIGVSHFAECRENRPVTVWGMLTNLLKSLIPHWWGKWKSDPESVSGIGSPPKVNQFFQLVGPSFNGIGFFTFAVILHSVHTDRMTDKPSCSVIA